MRAEKESLGDDEMQELEEIPEDLDSLAGQRKIEENEDDK